MLLPRRGPSCVDSPYIKTFELSNVQISSLRLGTKGIGAHSIGKLPRNRPRRLAGPGPAAPFRTGRACVVPAPETWAARVATQTKCLPDIPLYLPSGNLARPTLASETGRDAPTRPIMRFAVNWAEGGACAGQRCRCTTPRLKASGPFGEGLGSAIGLSYSRLVRRKTPAQGSGQMVSWPLPPLRGLGLLDTEAPASA